MIEIVGTLGSVLIVLSFVFKNIRTIRIVNLAGSVLFIIYSLNLQAWSSVGLNVVMIGIHLYYLIRGDK